MAKSSRAAPCVSRLTSLRKEYFEYLSRRCYHTSPYVPELQAVVSQLDHGNLTKLFEMYLSVAHADDQNGRTSRLNRAFTIVSSPYPFVYHSPFFKVGKGYFVLHPGAFNRLLRFCRRRLRYQVPTLYEALVSGSFEESIVVMILKRTTRYRLRSLDWTGLGLYVSLRE